MNAKTSFFFLLSYLTGRRGGNGRGKDLLTQRKIRPLLFCLQSWLIPSSNQGSDGVELRQGLILLLAR